MLDFIVKAFSACLFLSFLPRSSHLSPFFPCCSGAHFLAFALPSFLFLSLASSVLFLIHLFHPLFLTPLLSVFSSSNSVSRCQWVSYSICHVGSLFYQLAPFLFSHLVEAIWLQCGGLSVSRAVCAPSNTVIKTHTAQTHTAPSPSLSTHKPEQVWSITLHNHLLPHSHSLALSPSLSRHQV